MSTDSNTSSDTSAAQETHKIYHVIILDRSSSMSSALNATISGFNENLQDLIKQDKDDDEIENIVSLVTFSSQVDQNDDMWCQSLDKIEELTTASYRPSGSTALNDAIGCSITKLKAQIQEELDAQDANVVVTIFTDGEENSSKEFRDYTKLKALIDELTQGRMWTFSFIGCEESTLAAARSMGISAANVMRYDGTAEGTSNSFQKLARSRTAYTSKIKSANALKGTQDYGAALQASQADFFAEDAANDQIAQDPSQSEDTDSKDA